MAAMRAVMRGCRKGEAVLYLLATEAIEAVAAKVGMERRPVPEAVIGREGTSDA